jgi:hypothetical protein
MSASSCNSPRTLPYTPHFHPFPIASILPVPFHIHHANCPTLPPSHFELSTDINAVKTSLMMTTQNAEEQCSLVCNYLLSHQARDINSLYTSAKTNIPTFSTPI